MWVYFLLSIEFVGACGLHVLPDPCQKTEVVQQARVEDCTPLTVIFTAKSTDLCI